MTKLISYKFQFFDINPVIKSDGTSAYPNADGQVIYELLTTYRGLDSEERILYLKQLFSKRGLRYGKGDIDNIWEWDGNRENPTISPSFLWEGGRLHLFVRNGKLDILKDTTVDCSEVKRII